MWLSIRERKRIAHKFLFDGDRYGAHLHCLTVLTGLSRATLIKMRQERVDALRLGLVLQKRVADLTPAEKDGLGSVTWKPVHRQNSP